MDLLAEHDGRRLWWIPRIEWGASSATETFIRNRYTAAPSEKVCVQVHHTAAVDGDDSTPNRWDFDEAVVYMKKLQTVRPDLGPLPYSENTAVAEDGRTVWLFEGRGLAAVGAHTVGHNREGHAFGTLGNFDVADATAATSMVWGIEQRARMLKAGLYPYLGSERNPKGWAMWGHRDSAIKSCPGNHLYPLLANTTLTGPIHTPDGSQEETMSYLPIKHGDGTGDRAFKKSDVASIQALLNRTYDAGLTVDGHYGDATVAAVVAHMGGGAVGDGKAFVGNDYDDLIDALIGRRVREHVAAQPHQTADVAAAIATHAANPDAHHA